MGEFKQYRKIKITEMRPYILGEPLYGIAVSPNDDPTEGGVIARDPDNHKDQWFVNQRYFDKNYIESQPINTNGSFGYCIKKLLEGKKMRRSGWNGKNMFIAIQRPGSKSMESQPYIYIDTRGLITDNPYAPKERVPW